ncbi:TIGR03085 family metal-binding protein [Arachnia rubra]|mgnify:FL=1|jgi:TIGR03085 family protein|uniref:TIGR03085 family protein n=1 Tax=Arachnia rubra TaxID=1547448 RepID=A0ABX7Y8B3_9ACTN|nr:TIGR03085 family metal-binding protein [Arachnia rubra]MBB1577276.1 TIGR03085 family protein [Propionibacterium sp.]QUC09460.1 TIGR03085 family protein [Arachnia rubra]BCR80949.1 TIGR03085 family protein [Arachnia rubra]
MSFASRQRALLCDLMSELGPLAPTKCEGWNVGDLAAHMWVREHRPAALPGIGSQRFADRTERIQIEALHLKGFEALVKELRSPGWVMRPLDRVVNAVEFFVHHEDVLRANGRSQQISERDQAQLLRTVRVLAFRAQRTWGGQLVLAPAGSDVIRYGRGNRPVRLAGLPSELLLFLTGRESGAEITGEPSTVEELREAIGGL